MKIGGINNLAYFSMKNKEPNLKKLLHHHISTLTILTFYSLVSFLLLQIKRNDWLLYQNKNKKNKK
jgi:hypothetical protein